MKTTKILCVGNSFSEDATALLNPMLASYGIDALVVNLFIGGCSLQQHWVNIQLKKQDYLYVKNGVGISPGNPNGRMVSINEIILEEQWDIVTIQQSSILSGLVDSFFPDIELLLDYVKKHVTKTCKIYLHEPWSWESTYQWDPYEGEVDLFEEHYSGDEIAMFNQISETYSVVSHRFNLPIIPSGSFIHFLRQFDEFNYRNEDSTPLCKDKRHMHEIYGRYALSLLWAHILFSVEINLCNFYPSIINNSNKMIFDKIKGLCNEFIQV